MEKRIEKIKGEIKREKKKTEKIMENDPFYYSGYVDGLRKALKIIDKKVYVGRWIVEEPGGVWSNCYRCSRCGHNILSCKLDLPKYCGGCGRKMESEE